ncbi:MAG: DNA translocase FtsK 4TM domain-containing protein [Candidatus Margulisiibacteriota bacterium]|nr:DNA translocase FtsK 4TM domain-containing protein [Candidatus Margulisiibacteriota bacterium]
MPPKSKNRKKARNTKNDKPKSLPSKFKQDIVGILLLALAVFVFTANLSTSTGLVGFFVVKTVLRSALGVGVLVLPFFIALYGAILLLRHEVKELTVRLTGLSVLFIAYIAVAQFYSVNYFPDIGSVYFAGAGGLIGYGAKYALTRVIGNWGAYIILTALTMIGTLMIMNVTALSVIAGLYHLLRPERNEEEKEKTKGKNEGKKTIAEQLPVIKDIPTELEVIPSPPPPPEPEHKPVVEFPLPKFETETEPPGRVKVVSADSPKKKYSKYNLPPLDLLDDATAKEKKQAQKLGATTEQRKVLLEEALRNFGVGARVVAIFQGPAVTRYELQPEPGVKVSRIANLADDIALNLAASGVRIEAPVPGKSVVGIEVPNALVTPVRLKEIVNTKRFKEYPSKLCIGIGKDLGGQPVFGDIAKMPHILIAGTTGSGKSVAINSLITSILLRATPEEVKMLMIDPKMVELSIYNGIPHLLAPVVTNPKKAAATLKGWVLPEMERRYKLFHDKGARNLKAYNNKVDEEESLPEILVIVDELADMMMVAANEVEASICRVAQMARATGIHLVIATQRPSVDVITGLIKANIPSRIAFAVATQIDSRVILDASGAEKLLGRGDMLYNPIGAMKPTRVQGSFVTDKETEKIIKFVKEQCEAEYLEEIETIKGIELGKGSGGGDGGEGERDELFSEVAKLITSTGQASTSYVQRKFRIGYNRAARLMDEMESAGVVSPPEGENKPRRILASLETLKSLGVE